MVSGVASGLQHLLFRGRVLRDDHVLSDYQIGRAHVVYLVVRPPLPRLSQSNAASNFNLSGMGSQRRQIVEEIPDALTRVSSVLTRNNANNSQISARNLERLAQNRRQLLIGGVAQSLSNISMLLGNRGYPSSQRLDQGRTITAVESEVLLSNLGSSLIELGRTISRIAMGERTPEILLTNTLQVQIPSNGARNLPVASDPRNAVITRQTTYTFYWPLPQPTTEEELDDED